MFFVGVVGVRALVRFLLFGLPGNFAPFPSILVVTFRRLTLHKKWMSMNIPIFYSCFGQNITCNPKRLYDCTLLKK